MFQNRPLIFCILLFSSLTEVKTPEATTKTTTEYNLKFKDQVWPRSTNLKEKTESELEGLWKNRSRIGYDKLITIDNQYKACFVYPPLYYGNSETLCFAIDENKNVYYTIRDREEHGTTEYSEVITKEYDAIRTAQKEDETRKYWSNFEGKAQKKIANWQAQPAESKFKIYDTDKTNILTPVVNPKTNDGKQTVTLNSSEGCIILSSEDFARLIYKYDEEKSTQDTGIGLTGNPLSKASDYYEKYSPLRKIACDITNSTRDFEIYLIPNLLGKEHNYFQLVKN